MDRTELTLIAALALIVAAGVGWALRWGYDLLNPPPPPEPVADSEWAVYAKACEAERDQALAARVEVETAMNNRLKETAAERDAAMESLGGLRQQIAELEAAMAKPEG